MKIELHSDLATAERLWRRHWPAQGLFDSWSVRSFFHQAFNRPPLFLTATHRGRFMGLLALSWIEEAGCFGHFPGETWQGKTWLEQNRVVAADAETVEALLEKVPGAVHLRYLTPDTPMPGQPCTVGVDEVGYLFCPEHHGGDYATYLAGFSGKFRKKLRRELERLGDGKPPVFRYDRFDDLDWLLRLNLAGFQADSYFNDRRFRRAFLSLACWLADRRRLRITTVMFGDTVAAVDLGVDWGDTYTLLAGGTHPGYPGVAKLINLHHLDRACRQGLKTVDFLCGDFNWKTRFRLHPRPLYAIRQPACVAEAETGATWPEVQYAYA